MWGTAWDIVRGMFVAMYWRPFALWLAQLGYRLALWI